MIKAMKDRKVGIDTRLTRDAPLLETLPAGHKQTEVGVIPEEWECRRLGDLATRVGSGITPTGGERVYVKAGRPFLRSQNIGWGALNLADLAFITDELHASFMASEIKEGDVLLNITGASIGRSAVADTTVARGNVNQHVCEIRTDPKRLDPNFLNSYLLSAAGQSQIDIYQAGGNRQGLNYSQIRSFLIPRPAIPEQRAIAEALSDVDKLLGALEKLIAKNRAIKQAAMQQLLTGKTRLPGFSGAWETTTLGEATEIRNGATPNTHIGAYWNGSIPWCTPTDITSTPGKYLQATDRSITEAGLASCAATLLPVGALFLCSRATIGEVKIATSAVCTNQGFKSLVCKEGVSNEFLYYLLLTLKSQMIERAIGSTFLEIGKRDVASIEVRLPQYDEQRAIAAVLSDMDTEIAALERRRDKTHAIKQGMTQQLLTGRVRLVKPE